MKIYLAAALLIALNFGWIDSFAQENSSKSQIHNEVNLDSINIQNIVSGKIEAAKEKQNQQNIISNSEKKIQQKEDSQKIISQNGILKNENLKNEISGEKIPFDQNLQNTILTASILDNIYFKIFILVDIFLAALLFLGWKRRKNKIEQEVKSRFKKNIKKLREEKIKVRPDEQLGKIRKSLQKHPVVADVNEFEITKQAKELSISKGEIYLAAKLQAINKE